MQRNISPVVAVILILIVVAAVAFVWMKFTAGEKPTAGMPGPPAQMGSRRGSQRQTDTDAAQRGRRGRRGGRQAPGGDSTAETAPGGTQADEEED